MFTSYITTAGQIAAANAAAFGYKIDLVRFKCSDTVVTETDPSIIRAYTELPGTIVYDSGNNPTDNSIKYEIVNNSNVVITVFLNADVGPFTLGSIGLYLSDGTLFTILQLEQTYPKTANNTNIVGNNYAFPFVLTLTLQTVLDLSVLPENSASLPIVSDETSLPSYTLAPYSNYFVQEYAGTGKSAIACRTSSEWQFILASSLNLTEGWIHVDSSDFDSGTVEGSVVYFNNTTNLWSLADGEDVDIKVIGIKHGDGVRISSFYYKENAFIQGTDYFCNTAPSQGQLVTFSTKWFIGTALTNSILVVDPERLDTDIYIPTIDNLYQASLDNSNIIQLSLPDTGIYPAAYETGLEIRFICPVTVINNQQIQIQGLEAVPLTKMLIGQTSVSYLAASDIVAGTLVSAIYLATDGVDGAFRLLPSQVNDKVSRGGDIMTGNLQLPSATFPHSTDSSKNKKITTFDDAGSNQLKIGLAGSSSKDFIIDYANTIPKFYNASGKIDFNSTLIKGVADPVDLQDAASKNYVDNSATRTPLGYIYGLTLANNQASPLTLLDVSSGISRDSSNSTDITLSSSLTKDLNTSWLAGNNQGGRFSGVSLTNATWYHVFVIKNTSGQVDVGFDNNINATNKPSGYNYYRRIGSIYYISGVSGIKGFTQIASRFEFTAPIQDVANVSQAYGTETLRTLTLPTGLVTLAHLTTSADSTGSGTAFLKVYSANKSESTLVSDATMYVSVNAVRGAGEVNVLTNTLSQVKSNAATVTGSPTVLLTIYTNGWTDISLGVVNSAAAASTNSTGKVANWALITYDVATGTNGGSSTSGSWQQRSLNTVSYDTNSIVTLSNNQFILQPGNYILESWQVVVDSSNIGIRAQARIRDVTNNVTVANSLNARLSSGSTGSQGPIVVTPPQYVSITVPTTYELDYYVENGTSTYGLGQAFGIGTGERYAAVSIRNADNTVAALPTGYLSGLTLSNSTLSPLLAIDIAAGVASDSTGSFDLRLNTVTTKLINASFLTGNNQGGLASSLTLTNATWYHVFIISNKTSSDIYFDNDVNAVNRPGGFVYYRRIGSIYYINSVSGIRPFIQRGNYFLWNNLGSLDVNASTSTTATLITLSVPLGVPVEAHFNASNISNGTLFTCPDTVDVAPSISAAPLANNNVGGGGSGHDQKFVLTNSYAQIRQRSISVNTYTIYTVGWKDISLGAVLSGGTISNAPVTFSVSAAGNFTTSGNTKVTNLTNVAYNTGTYFDPSTSKFTPQVAGYYQINFGVAGTSTGSFGAFLYFNGSGVATAGLLSSGNSLAVRGSKILYFNGTTDYAELYTNVQNGLGNTDTYLEGSLLNKFQANLSNFLPKGYLNGFTLSNSTTTPLTNIDIAAGVASDSTGSFDIKTNAIISKNISSTWAAGTNNGGVATSLTLTNATWYHVFIISDGANIDAYFDTSITAANKPAGYSYYRRIGSVYYISSGSGIRQFQQFGGYFEWNNPNVLDYNSTVSTAGTLITLSIPLGVVCRANIVGRVISPSQDNALYFSNPNVANIIPDDSAAPLAIVNQVLGATDRSAQSNIYVISNTSSQVRVTASLSGSAAVVTNGWFDLGLGSTNSATLGTASTPTVPYSVNSATTDANGNASFVTKVSNTSIGFTFTTPIQTTFPDGSRGFYSNSTQLPNITGISTDGTYYIVEEKSSVYVTTLRPVESYTAPVSPATNQLWLDRSVSPYNPKKWNGSSWIVTQFNKWGEFIRTSGVIPSTITNYALNGIYVSPLTSVASNNTYLFQSNIGSIFVQTTVMQRANSTYPWAESQLIDDFSSGQLFGPSRGIVSATVTGLIFKTYVGYTGFYGQPGGHTTGEVYLTVKRTF